MRFPQANTGLLAPPRPDYGQLRSPRADVGAVRFPPRPVFAVLVTAPAMAAGVASAVIVLTPWRFADAVGSGAAVAAIEVGTAVEVDAIGIGEAVATVVKTEIDVIGYGEGAATLTPAVVATMLSPAVASGAGTFAQAVAALLPASASAMGTAAATMSARTTVTILAAGSGAGSATVAASVGITSAAAALGAAGLAVFTGYTYADDFNRASLGSNWVTIGSLSPVITGSDRVQAGTGGAVNATSSYSARYASVVAFDSHRSRGTLIAPTGSSNFTLGTGVWVRGTTGGDRVEAVFTPTSVVISTKTGGTGGTNTTRVTQAGLAIATGGVIELVANGGVYTAYVDGVSVASWTDTGGVIPIDSSHRSVGITLFSNRSFSSAYTYGWALDDWIGRDG